MAELVTDVVCPQVKMLKPSSAASSSKLRSPVVRWLDHAPPECGQIVREPGNHADTDNTDVPGPSAALQEAIDEQLPHRPPQAHTRPILNIPHNHLAATPSFRRPQLRNSPSRSFPIYTQSCDPDAIAHPPVLVNQSSPSQTSLESLRTFAQRRMHTSASQSEPSASSITRSWFRWRNQSSVDQLLVEEDRAETVTKEAEKIRWKCKAHDLVAMHLVDQSIQIDHPVVQSCSVMACLGLTPYNSAHRLLPLKYRIGEALRRF